MAVLWRLGFFGKGLLSRSDPSWKIRTIRRLGLNDPDGVAGFSSEDVTNQRREERRRFKHERTRVQQLEHSRRLGPLSAADDKELEQLNEKLKAWRHQATVAIEQPEPPKELREEDEELLEPADGGARSLKADIEHLQLQPVEFFFLYFGLAAVEMAPERSFKEVLDLLVPQPSPRNQFLLEYVVYHHYRSLGWCVRLGIKFGCDMLLYKRGPPFTHAEFAVKIMAPEDSQSQWSDLASLARVVGGVKKTLVLVYVRAPEAAEFVHLWRAATCATDFVRVLKSYQVTEILYRRWVPSRTRD